MNKLKNALVIFLIKVLIFSISFPTFSFGLLMIFFGDFLGNPTSANFFVFLIMGIGPSFLGGYSLLNFVFSNDNLLALIDKNQINKQSLILEYNQKVQNKTKPKNKKEVLYDTFYELLELRGGKVTSLNLAMEVAKEGIQITGKEANDFLTEKAKEFNHSFLLGENGEVIYDFEYLSNREIQELKKTS